MARYVSRRTGVVHVQGGLPGAGAVPRPGEEPPRASHAATCLLRSMPHTAVASTCMCAWTLGRPEAGLVALIRARSLPRCCSLLKRVSFEDGEADVGQLGLELFQARVDVAAARPSFVLATGATQRAAPVRRSGERKSARRCDLEAVSSRSWTRSAASLSAGSPAFARRAAVSVCWVVDSRRAPGGWAQKRCSVPANFPSLPRTSPFTGAGPRQADFCVHLLPLQPPQTPCGCAGNGSTSCCRRAGVAAPLPSTPLGTAGRSRAPTFSRTA